MRDKRTDELGHLIQTERERLGWNRDRLGVEAGISGEAVRLIEIGQTTARFSTLLAVCDVLGIELTPKLGRRSSKPLRLASRP